MRKVKGQACCTALSVLLAGAISALSAEKTRPDIVFIVLDDLNDWVGGLGGHRLFADALMAFLPKPE